MQYRFGGIKNMIEPEDVHVENSRTGILIAGLVGGLCAGIMLLLGRTLFGRK
jgi:hypothetical protein